LGGEEEEPLGWELAFTVLFQGVRSKPFVQL
jgi:hypothetical protein